MKSIVICVVLALAVAHPSGVDNGLDELDVKSILEDQDQLKAVFACLLDQGPCNKLQKLRDNMPNIVETKCGQCTPQQKEKYEHVNKVLLEKFPDKYKDLAEKYEPKTSKH